MVSYRVICALLLASAVPARADEITIQADATLHRRASSESTALLSLAAGEPVQLLAASAGWIKVRVRGRTGWVPEETMVEVLPAEPEPADIAAAEEPQPVDEIVEEPEPVVTAPRARTIDVHVAAGLSVITQGFRTTGGTVRDNYNIGVTAATVAASGGYLHRLRDDIVLGAELAVAYGKAMPGIRSADPETGEVVTTGFAVRDLALRIVGGWDLERPSGLVLQARLGVRQHVFAVAAVQDPIANPTRMPSELQLSPTIGAGVAIPRVTAKLGLQLALDTYLAGTHTRQTRGQEDGTRAHAIGATLQSVVSYRWRPNLDVRFTHEAGVTAMDFGEPDAMSERVHAGTAVARFDVVHRITLGLAKGF